MTEQERSLWNNRFTNRLTAYARADLWEKLPPLDRLLETHDGSNPQVVTGLDNLYYALVEESAQCDINETINNAEMIFAETGNLAGVNLAQIARVRIGDARLVVRRLRAEVEALIAKRDAAKRAGGNDAG